MEVPIKRTSQILQKFYRPFVWWRRWFFYFDIDSQRIVETEIILLLPSILSWWLNTLVDKYKSIRLRKYSKPPVDKIVGLKYPIFFFKFSISLMYYTYSSVSITRRQTGLWVQKTKSQLWKRGSYTCIPSLSLVISSLIFQMTLHKYLKVSSLSEIDI